MEFQPLRTLPAKAQFKAGDVLVVFGELFSRGYANGIVDEAEKAGLKIIRSTVGRRDDAGALRPLNETELASQAKPFINIPLEAGFDLEPCSQDGSTPVSQLAHIKLSAWESSHLDWDKVADSRKKGDARFKKHVDQYMRELEAQIPDGANVIFLHTMAGGVPRAKIILPVINRIVKGVGDRHQASEIFWKSELGQLCAMSFEDVTAQSFETLIEKSAAIRSRVEKTGGSTRYLAYGYHGTEVLIKNEYVWQSYAPYIQGWAKLKLENLAKDAVKKGLSATVYNCPEILTNSSSIFVGVEVPLYPFIAALKKEKADSVPAVHETLSQCLALLKPQFSSKDVVDFTDQVLMSEPIRRHCEFDRWPQHNSKDQMETLIAAAEKLIDMHKDPKNLMTFALSELIFRATGYIMFHDSWKIQKPVLWLGHDVLAKALATGQTL
jgi:hypothetical protein